MNRTKTKSLPQIGMKCCEDKPKHKKGEPVHNIINPQSTRLPSDQFYCNQV
jgi:hypothetical protein